MRVLTVADATALALLCEALGEWRAADDIVRAEGVVYESTTRSGVMKRPHPCVAIRGDAWRRAEKMLAKFGLTPSDRSRVETARHAEPGTPNPWDEVTNAERFLFGARSERYSA
jgi:P27 family predicted phage terminase small subunit